jgi:hypothetical protein
MAVYGSPDSASLVAQAPAGNGDGNIDAPEYVSLEISHTPGTMDGELDPGAYLLSSSGGLDLYAGFDGENLYVATQAVSQTSGLDHFILVGDGAFTPAAAPWAKSGTVAAKVLYLGNEDSNDWCGWFDEEGGLLDVYAVSASGGFLEGIVRLDYHLESPQPDSIFLAVGAYESPDAGFLSVQVPPGDGDINIDADEYVYLSVDISGVRSERRMPDGPPALVKLGPNPFRSDVHIELDGAVPRETRVAIYDLSGRLVRFLTDGTSEGFGRVLCWDGTDGAGNPVSPGIYFCRFRCESMEVSRKLVLIK